MKVPPFLTELLGRLISKNPKFFKIIQLLAGLLAAIAFLPELFVFLEIPAPAFLAVVATKSVKIGALITIVLAQLPNADPK